MRYKGLLSLLLIMMTGAPVTAQDPINIGTRLELFVDDYLVESLSGTASYDLKKPVPREVSLVTDESWEGNVCGYYTIFQDESLYRMYYRGFHYVDGTGAHPQVTCYAESTDGITWTKPNLGLIEYEGSTQNNIIWKDPGSHNFTPFKDTNPNAAPDARYKALSWNVLPNGNGLYALKSPDGLHWSLMSQQPVITEGSFDSQNTSFWDAERGCYVDYHRQARDGVRDIKTATSHNFLSWSNPDWLVYPPGTPQEHLYTNAILPYERAPHLLLGFPTRFYSATAQTEPILMSSRDGETFTRWNDAIIPMTAPEDRDGVRSNYMAWGLLQLPHSDRELSVYATEAYYEGPDSRIRRFTYRVDGFVSVNATGGMGQLLTKPLVFAGDRMQVNFATFDQGALRAELQDVNGNPLPGYSLTDFQPLSGDEIDQVLSWNGGNDVGPLSGTPVRVLFELNNADLYSFQFAGDVPEPPMHVLFEDNFENAPSVSHAAYPDMLGDCDHDPVAQVGTWDIAGSGLTPDGEDADYLIQVTDHETPGPHGGDNYLRTAFPDGGTQAYALGWFDGGATTEDLTLSTRFYAKSNVTKDGRVFLYDENKTYAVFVRMGEAGVAGGVAGQVQMYDGGDWVNSEIEGGYEADAWHHLEVSTDWENRQYSVSLDGEVLETGLAMKSEATNMAALSLSGWGYATDPPPLFDDVIVYQGIQQPLAGDLNSDGFVGGDDLDIVRSFWGQNVTAGDLLSGDPSGDGFVGGDDLDIVRANWGQGAPPTSSAVPEPSLPALLLGLTFTVFVLVQRRRNSGS